MAARLLRIGAYEFEGIILWQTSAAARYTFDLRLKGPGTGFLRLGCARAASAYTTFLAAKLIGEVREYRCCRVFGSDPPVQTLICSHGRILCPLKRSCDTDESFLQLFQRFDAGCVVATT